MSNLTAMAENVQHVQVIAFEHLDGRFDSWDHRKPRTGGFEDPIVEALRLGGSKSHRIQTAPRKWAADLAFWIPLCQERGSTTCPFSKTDGNQKRNQPHKFQSGWDGCNTWGPCVPFCCRPRSSEGGKTTPGLFAEHSQTRS